MATKIPTPQEHIDELVAKAQVALQEFMALDQDTIDNIVHEMALAGLAKQQVLAKMAVEETGRGIYEDKITKNIFATEYIWHSIKYQLVLLKTMKKKTLCLLQSQSVLLLVLPL